MGRSFVRAFEGGLFEYNSRLLEYKNMVRHEFTRNVTEGKNELNLNNLRPAFFVLVVGYIINGTFVFVDVLLHFYKRWRR